MSGMEKSSVPSVSEKEPTQREWKDMNVFSKCMYMVKNTTVEPIGAFYFMPSILASLATQNLNLEKACAVNLEYSREVCAALSARQTAPYKQEELHVQRLVAKMMTWKNVVQSAIPAMLIMFLGAWSDRHRRRKPLILLPITGEFMTCVGLLFCTYFFYELPMEVAGVVEGLFPAVTGGWCTMFMAIYSYIGDITSVGMRTVRIGFVSVFVHVGIPVGMALSGFLYKTIGFYGVFSTSAALYVIIFAYIYFRIREGGAGPAAPAKGPGKCCGTLRELADVRHVADTFRALHRYRGTLKTQLVMVMICGMLVVGPIHGGVESNPGPVCSDPVLEEIRDMRRDFVDRMDGHSALLQELLGYRQRVESLELQVEDLSRENSLLSRKVDYLENQSRRNNVLFFGLEEEKNERWEDSERLVREVAAQVGVDLSHYDVERAHRVGRRQGKRPIVAKLASYKKREELLAGAAQHLRNAPIRVAEDFSAPVRQTRKLLGPYLQKARAQGHRASMRFDRLVIDGRRYTLRELEGGSAESAPARPAARAPPPPTTPAAAQPPTTRRAPTPAGQPLPSQPPPVPTRNSPGAPRKGATRPAKRGLTPPPTPPPSTPPPPPPRPAPADARAPSPAGRRTRRNPAGQCPPAQPGTSKQR